VLRAAPCGSFSPCHGRTDNCRRWVRRICAGRILRETPRFPRSSTGRAEPWKWSSTGCGGQLGTRGSMHVCPDTAGKGFLLDKPRVIFLLLRSPAVRTRRRRIRSVSTSPTQSPSRVSSSWPDLKNSLRPGKRWRCLQRFIPFEGRSICHDAHPFHDLL
jgi:hypothetical protein